jgi:hypothetical protein
MSISGRTRAAIGAASALAALSAMGGSAAAQGSAACPGTFTVLHNDRIGELQLSAGRYDITVQTPATLSCERASNLFARFLQDFQGDLPGQWKVKVNKSAFVNKAKGEAFRVSPAGGGGGGGGGGNNPTGREKCPGTFQVLHNDSIGKLRIPAGNYVITVKRMTCQNASQMFRQFLQDTDGNLGGGWRVRARKAKFQNRAENESFRIKRAAGGSSS